MPWLVEDIPELKGFTVEWSEPGNYILSKKNTVYRTKDLVPPFEAIGKIDAPFWKELAVASRLAQRLLRFMVTNIIPLENGELFVTFDKTAGILNNGEYRPLKGLARPCRVLRSGCAKDDKGRIFFGEYLANDERGEMRVYCYEPGRESLDVVYTFPPDTIKHIHGLYFEEHSGAIFCLTGDDDKECRILRSTDNCRSFETLGGGDETWRAVSVLFDKDSFYYGTDAEFRANHIYKVNRETLERTRLGEVSGTVFYSKKVGDDLFFASTAENAPSQKENVAALWHVDGNEELKQVVSFKKDGWHPTFFQFGMIHFPSYNKSGNEIYIHLVGVEEDAQVFKISKT